MPSIQFLHSSRAARFPARSATRLTRGLALALLATTLSACSSIGLGISLPIGGLGSVSVGVDSSGRVGGGVAVGTGGVSVGVGGSLDLPRKAEPPSQAASAASAR